MAEPPHKPAWADEFGEDRFGIFASFQLADVNFMWRWIPPGTFWMGSPENEPQRYSREGPRHLVTLRDGFWMGEAPLMQEQWKAVAGQDPGCQFQSPQLPVEQVSWHDCREWMEQLNELRPELFSTFPTEAQWEHACRAGGSGALQDDLEFSSKNLAAVGWFTENSKGKTHEVKQKSPNAWGLFDMLGNVYEWCLDGRRKYSGDPVPDPQGSTEDGAMRAFRGGSWNSSAWSCRAAYRFENHPGDGWYDLGLRLVAPGQPPEAGAKPELESAEARSQTGERRSRG